MTVFLRSTLLCAFLGLSVSAWAEPREGEGTREAEEQKQTSAEAPKKDAAQPGLLTKAGAAVGSAVTKTSEAVSHAMTRTADTVSSAVTKTSTAVGSLFRDEALRMRDFFDVQLPGVLGKRNLVLDFEPKVGDLLRREFVRYPIELRYGLGSRWESYVGFIPFSPNPFDSGEEHRWGLGLGKLGLRRDTEAIRFILPRISFGIEAQVPLGEPPVDLIDHYVHVRPWTTLSRPLESWEGATFFVALSHDKSFTCPSRDNVPERVIRRDISEIAPGLLYMPNQYGAFIQYGLRYQEEPDGQRLVHLGKLGVIWDMPLETSRRWHLPGKWQIELGYKVTDEEGESPDHGIHARVKWRTNLFKKGRGDHYPKTEPRLYR